MNVYNFGQTKYSKDDDQLEYIDFRMSDNHYIFYTWEHPITKKRYDYKTLNENRTIDYYNNSDSMTDYFDIAYYTDINIGKWNKPYICTI